MESVHDLRMRQSNLPILPLFLFLIFLMRGIVYGEVDAQGFMNHQFMEKAFASELGKQFEADEVVSLSTLNRQLRRVKKHPVKLTSRARKIRPTEDLFDFCRESVVIIGHIYKCDHCNEWHTSIAGGAVLSRDGIILTNYHVMDADDRSRAVGVRTWDGRQLKVEAVLSADELNDIAVIKVDADDLVPAPLAKQTRVGESVFAISHPVEHFYTFTEGKISGKSIDKVKGDLRRQISITADFAKGSSGCPVFNQYGEIVGLVRATSATYYDQRKGMPSNVQMVWKYIVPAFEIKKVIGEP